ncbi:MAG: proprotein convertase P-domain-containing protein [Myxococcota bacterium]
MNRISLFALLLLFLTACGDDDGTPVDAGSDAAAVDAARTDAGADAGADAAAEDAAAEDAAAEDAAAEDAAAEDAAAEDAAAEDAGEDAGTDASDGAVMDAGPMFPTFEDCDASRMCDPGFRCEGFVASIGLGKCVPTDVPPGEGADCTELFGCGEGLLCSGLGRGFSLCLPAWMRGSFDEMAEMAIPDDDELTRTITVYGLATVDMDVELEVILDHPAPSELQVFLRNPDGNEVLAYDGSAAGDPPGRVEFRGNPVGFSGDESVNGEWRLRVVDDAPGNTGSLVRWTLTVFSRFD